MLLSMRKPRAKMSDMVSHPAYPRMKVTRRFALDWRASAERSARETERRRIADQLTPKLKRLDGWQAEVAGIAMDLGVTSEAIMGGFRQYDARVAAGKPLMPSFGPMLDDEYAEEVTDHDTGRTRTRWTSTPYEDHERVQMLVEHVLSTLHYDHKRQEEAKAPKPKLPRYRRTKEAMRKARARAEGRVKPRARKGPPTVDQRIASTEKSLATRRAALAKLEAGGQASMGELLRCQSGIAKTEIALATWRTRLKSTQNPA